MCVVLQVYQIAQTWYESLPASVKETIIRHFGAFPDKDEDLEVSTELKSF